MLDVMICIDTAYTCKNAHAVSKMEHVYGEKL